jgi:hypothetical protein
MVYIVIGLHLAFCAPQLLAMQHLASKHGCNHHSTHGWCAMVLGVSKHKGHKEKKFCTVAPHVYMGLRSALS